MTDEAAPIREQAGIRQGLSVNKAMADAGLTLEEVSGLVWDDRCRIPAEFLTVHEMAWLRFIAYCRARRDAEEARHAE